MPSVPPVFASGFRSDSLEDWLEDYVMERVTQVHPGIVFSVHARPRDGHYSIVVLPADPSLVKTIQENEIEAIEKELEANGVKVVIYVDRMAKPQVAPAGN